MRSRGRLAAHGAAGVAVLGAAAAVVLILVRHARGLLGRRVTGGILVADVGLYDAVGHRFLLRSFFEGVARDVAASAPEGARVLEVGCGPGRLSIRLSEEFGLDMTGLDLDPAMIDRARTNARQANAHDGRAPSFVVGDVASLSFPDGSFDLTVSTLSMHHWADPSGGIAEMARVLRPGGRALVWDFRPGVVPFHARTFDPAEHAHGSSLRLVGATPWRWPWRLSPIERIDLVREA
jgi:SAM-dependent methyltransferase